MDYALELEVFKYTYKDTDSFNPCFSGLCFGAKQDLLLQLLHSSFNPCFSGLCFGAFFHNPTDLR